VLWLLALWPGRRPAPGEIAAALGGIVLGLAVAVLPFAAADATALKFWTIDFHRLSLPAKNWSLPWRSLVALAPATWLLAAGALALAVVRRQWPTREFGVMLAATAALAANLLPGGTYGEYGVPFLLPLAAAAAALLHESFHPRPATAAAAAILLVGIQLTAVPLLFGRTGRPNRWLPPGIPAYNRELPAQLAGARRVVEANLAADAPFIGTHLILAAETGRHVPAVLRMGAFSFTAEMPPARAARLHLATRPQLDEWFFRRPDVTLLAFFKRWDLDYGWSVPSFTDVPDDARQETLDALQRHFDLAYQEGDYLLLVRRPVPPPP